jgi:hypothetical protein
MAVDDIKRSGRATQGVIVMRLREAEQVSTLAPVVTGDDGADDDATPISDAAPTGAEADASYEEPDDDEVADLDLDDDPDDDED